MPKKKSDRGYCLLCPTKGEHQGLKSKGSFLSSHARSQGHQHAYLQWQLAERGNGATFGESFTLATADDFFIEANDMERTAIVNKHFDWDLWYQPIRMSRTGRPITPPLPAPTQSPPASSPRPPPPPSPPHPPAQQPSSSKTTASAPPLAHSTRPSNPRQESSSSLFPRLSTFSQDTNQRDSEEGSPAHSQEDSSELGDDDQSELAYLAQRYSGESNVAHALARVRLGNSVLNLPDLGGLHTLATLTLPGPRERTPRAPAAQVSDADEDDQMDVDSPEDVEGTTALAQEGDTKEDDSAEAEMDEMRLALAEQQATTAADAIHFAFSPPSLEWPPMGPLFPWESRVGAIIFTQLARDIHGQTRSKVQFALDMAKALHPEDELPTAKRALTLPVGFPAPRLVTVSIREGEEFTIILPSDMLKMLVCRPDIYKQLIRFPTDSLNIIDSFCDTQRARELFNGFKSTTFRNSAGVNFFLGNIVEYRFVSESPFIAHHGRIQQIYQAKADSSIMIELRRITTSSELSRANPAFVPLHESEARSLAPVDPQSNDDANSATMSDNADDDDTTRTDDRYSHIHFISIVCERV